MGSTAAVLWKSSALVACGESDEESRLENEELTATPLSGLWRFFPLTPTISTGLAAGETDGSCLQGLATELVEGEETEMRGV